MLLCYFPAFQSYPSIYYSRYYYHPSIRMDFHEQLTVINDSLSNEIEASKNLRFISAEKWRKLMVRVLFKLRKKEFYDINLVDDLITVVEKMPEENLIETIMHIEPFRPNFMRGSCRLSREKAEYGSTRKDYSRVTTVESRRLEVSSIIKFKQEIHSRVRDSIFQIQQQNPKATLLQDTLALITEEQTLSKQFQKPYHPYRFVIEQFLFLLEHKYKNYINRQQAEEVQSIQEMLLYDLNLLQEFVIKASVPYLKIFTCGRKEERMEFQIQLLAFIKKYLEKHERINALIKKIVKYALKQMHKLKRLEEAIPNFIDVTAFKIEQKLQINGEYRYSLNAIIEFSQSPSLEASLSKLTELRGYILKDIDQYYKRNHQEETPEHQKQEVWEQAEQRHAFQVSVQAQLEILKFLLAKAKIFLIDTLAELKYLEVVLGEDDLSFKYDDASFMYAQLTVAIEFLTLDFA